MDKKTVKTTVIADTYSPDDLDSQGIVKIPVDYLIGTEVRVTIEVIKSTNLRK